MNSQHKWPVTRKMLPFDDVMQRYKANSKHNADDKVTPDFVKISVLPVNYVDQMPSLNMAGKTSRHIATIQVFMAEQFSHVLLIYLIVLYASQFKRMLLTDTLFQHMKRQLDR